VAANGTFEPLYRRVAEEYVRDLVRLCPWIRCVLLVGSAATGGVTKGDDLDLNIVVADGKKYTTNVLGGMLNRKYSMRYGKLLGLEPTHHYMIPMVVCLNIIWEESQVIPFRRQDEQVAYELFSGSVLHGRGFFDRMLEANGWIRGFYPQMYNGVPKGRGREMPQAQNGTRRVGLVERIARGGLFSFDRAVRMYLSRQRDTIKVMEYWDDLKQPYGLYDLPGSENGGPWDNSDDEEDEP
jgi:predicted nucleotidyltransferase